MTVSPEDGTSQLFDTLVSDLQTDISVSDGAITGTLKYVEDGPIPGYWGAGNFLALKFSDFSEGLTYEDVKVGLTPSMGSGLVTLDSDCNGVFKVTDKNSQKIKVVQTDSNGESRTQLFKLNGLTCQTEA